MFEQYKTFIGRKEPPNRFWPLTEPVIAAAEARLGYQFPLELRTFYLEIGHGFYAQGVSDRARTNVNRILSPNAIVDLVTMKSNPQRPPEGFPADTMPFFDTGSWTYLVLKPTNEPRRVYGPSGHTVISESVHEFFAALYNKSDFYIEKFQPWRN